MASPKDKLDTPVGELKISREILDGQYIKDSFRDQIPSLLEQIRLSDHPLIKETLRRHDAERAKRAQDTQHLLGQVATWSKDKDEKKLQEEALARLALDTELVEKFEKARGGYKAFIGGCTAPFKNQPIGFFISSAKEELSKHFQTLKSGQLPQGYSCDFNVNDVTILGLNPHNIFGNPKASILSTMLWTMGLTATGKKRVQDLDLGASTKKHFWYDNTALAMVAPLPEAMDLEALDPRFGTHWSYTFSDPKTERGIISPRGPYVYGGHRSIVHRFDFSTTPTPDYLEEDCSSALARALSVVNTRKYHDFTTLDFVNYYRYHFKTELGKTVPADLENWASTVARQYLANECEPIKIRDPQRIQPGMIQVWPGHMGVVSGFISAGKDSSIPILGYARSVESGIDGCGIQFSPYAEPRVELDETEPSLMKITNTEGKPTDRPLILFSLKGLAAKDAKGVVAHVQAAMYRGEKEESKQAKPL